MENKPLLRGAGDGGGQRARGPTNDVLNDEDRKVLKAGGRVQFEKIEGHDYRKTHTKGTRQSSTRPSSRSASHSTITTNAQDVLRETARTLSRIDALQAQSAADQQREIAKRMKELNERESMRQQYRSREEAAARVRLK